MVNLRRRALLNDDGGSTPPYTTLTAIQSSGVEYIDTDIYLNTTNWETNTQFEVVGDTVGGIIGAYYGSSTANGIAISVAYVSPTRYFGYTINNVGVLGNGSSWSYYSLNTPYNVIVTKAGNKITLGGALSGSKTSPYISSGGYKNGTLKLFFDGNQSYSITNIYSHTITLDSVLVRDFIPVELTDTVIDYWGNAQQIGAVGMWDMVTDKFFPNNGTGSFVAV